MNKILVVDDDSNIRSLVATILSESGFSVLEAKNGLEALTLLDIEKINLCIVDIMMPEMDGFKLCENVRQYYKEMPILMLTAKREIRFKKESYGLGADDYLTKPFDVEELILRVKALLKRYNIVMSQKINVGSLILDSTNQTIIDNENKINIPLREFELLFKLGSNAGKTFSRNQLIEDLWGYDFEGNERTLDVHIGRLREKFSTSKYGFEILTIRSLGYRLEINND